MPEKFVTWRDSYSIGIKVVDDQHKYLLELTNQLYYACAGDGGVIEDKFRDTVQSAVEYVGVHFATEEKLMDRTNYPDSVVHKNEHKMFVQKVLESVKAFEEGKNYTPNAFVRFLREWILDHVAMVDKKFGDYLVAMKKEGRL